MNKIALLNDAFRTSLTGGTVLLTVGVYQLPDMVKSAAIRMLLERTCSCSTKISPADWRIETQTGTFILSDAEELPLYANGLECRAQEHRLGGVVVRPIDAWKAQQ